MKLPLGAALADLWLPEQIVRMSRTYQYWKYCLLGLFSSAMPGLEMLGCQTLPQNCCESGVVW